IPLETKISQVKKNLRSGNAVIVFDNASATCNIFHKEDPMLKTIAP
ncbi:MAG: YheU family protein, partial [Desulfobacteraceae bacterium]|nr:YheU family protein [Desulfobacteraceae bacterium]